MSLCVNSLIHFGNRLIINDLYRTELCLIYPPHLIAIGALMVTLAYHTTTRPTIQQAHNDRTSGNSHKPQSSPQPRRSGRTGHGEKEKDKKPPQDVIGFLAGLNVSMSTVGTIVQEILSFYTLWDLFADEKNQDTKSGQPSTSNLLSRGTAGVKRDASGNPIQECLPPAPIDLANEPPHEPVTAASMLQAFVKMREARMTDLANQRPPPVNKMLEKTQNMNVD
jgi:cyclin C